MAGMTVMVKGVEVVMLPRLAKIFAVKFCGAAAGVASTISCVFVCGCCRADYILRAAAVPRPTAPPAFGLEMGSTLL